MRRPSVCLVFQPCLQTAFKYTPLFIILFTWLLIVSMWDQEIRRIKCLYSGLDSCLWNAYLYKHFVLLSFVTNIWFEGPKRGCNDVKASLKTTDNANREHWSFVIMVDCFVSRKKMMKAAGMIEIIKKN